MVRWWLVGLVVLAFAGVASAQTMTTAMPDTTFGSSRVGVASTTTRTITISNDAGASNALVYTIASDNPDFALSTAGGTVPAGQDATVIVTFTPSARDAIAGKITIEGNDGANASDEYDVSGSGISGNMVVTWTGSPNPLDFGTALVAGGTTTRTIKIANPSPANAPLEFSLDVTAGMADYAETDPANQTLAVGESIDVTVTFDPSGVGTRTGTVTVTSDDELNPSDTVALTGIGEGAAFTPSAPSLDFGTVDVGAFAEEVLTITNTGNLSGMVTSISSGNAAYTFVVTGPALPRTLAPDEALEVTVRFTPVDGSIVMADLSIATTGTPATLTIPMTGDGFYEDVSIAVTNEDDLMIDLGAIRVAMVTTRLVTVTNTGEAPATLALPTSDAAPCTVLPISPATLPEVLDPAAAATFEIRVTPAAVGAGACTITVTTDIPTTDTITIDYQGVAPDVSLALPGNAAINFGVLDVDAAAAIRTVVLENNGSAPLAVGPCTISGSTRFTVMTSCSDLQVAPASSATLSIAFDPMIEASESGLLTIGVDALGTSQVDVALSGVGADQRIDISALAVSFPDTGIGEPAPPIEYIDVFNPTNPATGVAETLHISMATTDDSVFQLANEGPFTVEPGAMIRLAITFRPTAARVYSATLVISSDASATPMAAIALDGRGIDVVQEGGCCDAGRASHTPLALCVLALIVRRRKRGADVSRN